MPGEQVRMVECGGKGLGVQSKGLIPFPPRSVQIGDSGDGRGVLREEGCGMSLAFAVDTQANNKNHLYCDGSPRRLA